MDFASVNPIARAILYEGYLLYPYRTSSLKNREPCAFGSLYPRAYAEATGDIEPWSMHFDCLIRGDGATKLQGAVRFLQPRGQTADEREVIINEIELGALDPCGHTMAFSFDAIDGIVQLSAERITASIFKLRTHIENQAAGTVGNVMLSTHAIFGVRGGRFLSSIDPPEEARHFADACKNRGAWPVLVGDRALENQILAAPIILYDFPEIAPESPGNLFDGTEIDELLTLRILTLTHAEKQAMRGNDRTRILLERTETLTSSQLSALHGGIRRPALKPGDRVVVRPRAHADVVDLALNENLATVVAVEQDFEGRVHYAVAIDDDPGADLGIEGKPGHRFFFRRDELKLVSDQVP
jgi:hypothetical protein